MTMDVVNITNLKAIVRRYYSEDDPIRKVILLEPDEMPRAEYLCKLMVWVKLIPSLQEN